MWENKGCRTNTALPSKNHTTSVKNEYRKDQEPNPMAEGIGIDATRDSNEDGLKYEHHDKPKRPKKPTRSERHGTRPPDIPKHCQTSLPPAAAWQLIAANASERPNKEVRDGLKDEITQVRDGEPERSESPQNLNARANPNLPTGTVRTCIIRTTNTSSRISLRIIRQCSGRKGAAEKRVHKHTN